MYMSCKRLMHVCLLVLPLPSSSCSTTIFWWVLIWPFIYTYTANNFQTVSDNCPNILYQAWIQTWYRNDKIILPVSGLIQDFWAIVWYSLKLLAVYTSDVGGAGYLWFSFYIAVRMDAYYYTSQVCIEVITGYYTAKTKFSFWKSIYQSDKWFSNWLKWKNFWRKKSN